MGKGIGARINRKYLNMEKRTTKCKRCGVCNKALHGQNQSYLCQADWRIENRLNMRHQLSGNKK